MDKLLKDELAENEVVVAVIPRYAELEIFTSHGRCFQMTRDTDDHLAGSEIRVRMMS